MKNKKDINKKKREVFMKELRALHRELKSEINLKEPLSEFIIKMRKEERF